MKTKSFVFALACIGAMLLISCSEEPTIDPLDIIDHGTCGENLTWTLVNKTKTLIISGEGPMTEFKRGEVLPWDSYRKTIKSVEIGKKVTSISAGAFYWCTGVTSITIPKSITNIGALTFAGCSSLTSITIPNSVTRIGEGAFSGCSSLTSITIPKSVIIIDKTAFAGCDGLASIIVKSGNPQYDSRTKCNAIIHTATNSLIVGCNNTNIPNSVTSIGDSAFFDCSSLTSITIPNSVISIGDGAFEACTSLSSITIPNSVTNIGENAFGRCSCLTSITIPNSITCIRWSTFSDCSSLTSITIPNSVTSIGEDAFWNCTSLANITIGNSVTSIGNYAFLDCYYLRSVTCLAQQPPTLEGNAFDQSRRDYISLYVPSSSVDLYRSAYVWGWFTNIIGI